MKAALNITILLRSAAEFARIQSNKNEPTLYGVTDGKAVGTFLERRFMEYLEQHFTFTMGNAAKGIDLPALDVDLKTTSMKQPQSSCPYKSARQKIYGLGYSLLVFVYEKTDDQTAQTGRLAIRHVVFVKAVQTADHQTTRGIHNLLDNNANEDDLVAFMEDRFLPVDEIEARRLAKEILANRPALGYRTISNALQWRLQYKRVIDLAGTVEGVDRVYAPA